MVKNVAIGSSSYTRSSQIANQVYPVGSLLSYWSDFLLEWKNMEQKQVQIRASEADLKGVYSNVMQISHTQEEFILDFFNIVGESGVLSARVILSPSHLKRMIRALEENLKKYEEKFGPIILVQPPTPPEIGFKPK